MALAVDVYSLQFVSLIPAGQGLTHCGAGYHRLTGKGRLTFDRPTLVTLQTMDFFCLFLYTRSVVS
jgi:hypothetical protein